MSIARLRAYGFGGSAALQHGGYITPLTARCYPVSPPNGADWSLVFPDQSVETRPMAMMLHRAGTNLRILNTERGGGRVRVVGKIDSFEFTMNWATHTWESGILSTLNHWIGTANVGHLVAMSDGTWFGYRKFADYRRWI